MYFMFFTHTVILINLYEKYISRLISAILGNVLFNNSRTFNSFCHNSRAFQYCMNQCPLMHMYVYYFTETAFLMINTFYKPFYLLKVLGKHTELCQQTNSDLKIGLKHESKTMHLTIVLEIPQQKVCILYNFSIYFTNNVECT